jgi:ribose 1,5-bisphosphokinase PhnN
MKGKIIIVGPGGSGKDFLRKPIAREPCIYQASRFVKVSKLKKGKKIVLRSCIPSPIT